MRIDWGERMATRPLAWRPMIPGVWDWGHAAYIAAATGLVSVAFTVAAPGISFTEAAPAIGFTGVRPNITFTEG